MKKLKEDKGEISDGYHTFNELYEFRKIYNAALFNEWSKLGKYSTNKSYRHHDGELCFDGTMFIVSAMLPAGQISNHYDIKDWDLFKVKIEERSMFEFDNHTPKDVISRLKSLLTDQVRRKRIGVIGYSEQEFDERNAEIVLNSVLSIYAKYYEGAEVVSGLTNVGIPALAYKEAKRLNLKTVGIACAKADEYEKFPVDKEIIIGDNWGDESKTFLSNIDVLIKVGGGKQSEKEYKLFSGTKFEFKLRDS